MRPSQLVALHRERMREIIAAHPVANPRPFGSVARGEDAEGSDLDLLVDPTDETTYFDLAALERELERLLGVSVDIATPGAIRRIEANVLRDLRPL